MSRFTRRAILLGAAIAIVLATCVSWFVPSGAAESEQTAVDQIAESYEIPLTNPIDHRELPSVLLVESATLDTKKPDGSGVNAPNGEIYLSLQMTSGPVQTPLTATSGWPSYFEGLTPLPGSSLRFDTSSGRDFYATELNPVSGADSEDSASIDGLVDATYFFTVPITTRRGTLVILPSHTVGTEVVQNSPSRQPLAVVVGGPTKIPLSFPKNLTVITSNVSAQSKRSAAIESGYEVASVFNITSTIIFVVFTLWIYRKVQRWRRRRRSYAQPVYVVQGTPAPSSAPAPTQTVAETVAPASPERPDTVARSEPVRTGPALLLRDRLARSKDATTAPGTERNSLEVNVLGPLTISPVTTQPGDPVKAIITYLALHSGTTKTLDDIQTAIWPLVDGVNDIKRPAMLNYMADVRKVIGEHHLPAASGKGGYQLVDALTDWDQFQKLIRTATTASQEESLSLRRQALCLVRGVPFAGENSRYFTWALSPAFSYKMIDTVTALAHELAKQSILQGDLISAAEVLDQGLNCDPTSLILWEDLTDVALETHDATSLHFHWRGAELVLDPKDVEALRARENG